MDEQERETLSCTHLTPAEVGRLLGKLPAQVREMIRRGELTQEQVGNRWLIPVRNIHQILNPSSKPREHQKRAVSKDQRSKPGTKRHEGTLPESTSPSQKNISKSLTTQKTLDLMGEAEGLDRMMKQIDEELRDLRSGLMNDEKWERIEELKTKKRKWGKNLQKLQTELSRRESLS